MSFNVKNNYVEHTHVVFFNNFIKFFANKVYCTFLIAIKKQTCRNNEICLYCKKHKHFINNCFYCFVKFRFVSINFYFFANFTFFFKFLTFFNSLVL